MTEMEVQRALGSWIGWHRVLVVPNLCYYHEMDVAVLTKAGYVWEYEIKLSQADWNRDQKKDVPSTVPDWAKGNADWEQFYGKPRRRMEFVKRFTYVYAKGLTCPDWVPEWAGLLAVSKDPPEGKTLVFDPVRWPTDRKVEKAPANFRSAMYEAIYFRYWRLRAV